MKIGGETVMEKSWHVVESKKKKRRKIADCEATASSSGTDSDSTCGFEVVPSKQNAVTKEVVTTPKRDNDFELVEESRVTSYCENDFVVNENHFLLGSNNNQSSEDSEIEVINKSCAEKLTPAENDVMMTSCVSLGGIFDDNYRDDSDIEVLPDKETQPEAGETQPVVDAKTPAAEVKQPAAETSREELDLSKFFDNDDDVIEEDNLIEDEDIMELKINKDVEEEDSLEVIFSEDWRKYQEEPGYSLFYELPFQFCAQESQPEKNERPTKYPCLRPCLWTCNCENLFNSDFEQDDSRDIYDFRNKRVSGEGLKTSSLIILLCVCIVVAMEAGNGFGSMLLNDESAVKLPSMVSSRNGRMNSKKEHRDKQETNKDKLSLTSVRTASVTKAMLKSLLDSFQELQERHNELLSMHESVTTDYHIQKQMSWHWRKKGDSKLQAQVDHLNATLLRTKRELKTLREKFSSVNLNNLQKCAKLSKHSEGVKVFSFSRCLEIIGDHTSGLLNLSRPVNIVSKQVKSAWSNLVRQGWKNSRAEQKAGDEKTDEQKTGEQNTGEQNEGNQKENSKVNIDRFRKIFSMSNLVNSKREGKKCMEIPKTETEKSSPIEEVEGISPDRMINTNNIMSIDYFKTRNTTTRYVKCGDDKVISVTTDVGYVETAPVKMSPSDVCKVTGIIITVLKGKVKIVSAVDDPNQVPKNEYENPPVESHALKDEKNKNESLEAKNEDVSNEVEEKERWYKKKVSRLSFDFDLYKWSTEAKVNQIVEQMTDRMERFRINQEAIKQRYAEDSELLERRIEKIKQRLLREKETAVRQREKAVKERNQLQEQVTASRALEGEKLRELERKREELQNEKQELRELKEHIKEYKQHLSEDLQQKKQKEENNKQDDKKYKQLKTSKKEKKRSHKKQKEDRKDQDNDDDDSKDRKRINKIAYFKSKYQLLQREVEHYKRKFESAGEQLSAHETLYGDMSEKMKNYRKLVRESVKLNREKNEKFNGKERNQVSGSNEESEEIEVPLSPNYASHEVTSQVRAPLAEEFQMYAPFQNFRPDDAPESVTPKVPLATMEERPVHITARKTTINGMPAYTTTVNGVTSEPTLLIQFPPEPIPPKSLSRPSESPTPPRSLKKPSKPSESLPKEFVVTKTSAYPPSYEPHAKELFFTKSNEEFSLAPSVEQPSLSLKSLPIPPSPAKNNKRKPFSFTHPSTCPRAGSNQCDKQTVAKDEDQIVAKEDNVTSPDWTHREGWREVEDTSNRMSTVDWFSRRAKTRRHYEEEPMHMDWYIRKMNHEKAHRDENEEENASKLHGLEDEDRDWYFDVVEGRKHYVDEDLY